MFRQTGLEEDVLRRSVEPMLRTGLSVEEYVLLRAIIYCNAGKHRFYSRDNRAVSWCPIVMAKIALLEARDLSSEGREIVRSERERYADLLLRYLQLKFGRERGANRYGEVISLVNAYVHFGQRYWDHINRMGVILRANDNIRLSGHFELVNDLMFGPRPNGWGELPP